MRMAKVTGVWLRWGHTRSWGRVRDWGGSFRNSVSMLAANSVNILPAWEEPIKGKLPFYPSVYRAPESGVLVVLVSRYSIAYHYLWKISYFPFYFSELQEDRDNARDLIEEAYQSYRYFVILLVWKIVRNDTGFSYRTRSYSHHWYLIFFLRRFICNTLKSQEVPKKNIYVFLWTHPVTGTMEIQIYCKCKNLSFWVPVH